MGEPLELIAFDFDGTLADTRPAIAETLSLTLRHFGRPPLDEREVVSRIGRPLRETLAAAGLRGWQLPAAERFYRSRYGEIAERHTKLYPGAAAALDVLAQAGVRLAVASSKGREALRESLAALGVAERLEVVIGAEDAERPKPDPEPVSRVLERTGGPPERTLVVGDTVHDVRMGRAAGCATAFVTYGYGDREEALREAPDWVVDSLPQLADLALQR